MNIPESCSPGEQTPVRECIVRLNRLYAVRSRVNEAIVHIHDLDTLYREVCHILVEQGSFKMAWIGIADTETRKVHAAAQWGDTGGYLSTIRIIAADVPEGKGPTGRAIYELKSVICGDIASDPAMLPWRDKALAHGFRSSSAFPIRADSVVVGALTVYSGAPHFFSAEEIYLLESLAADISHAADAIENEQRRRLAEEALRHSREQLRALSAYLLKAREEERIRIGREIHDELGQLLTAANLELDRAKRECGPNNSLEQKISGASELIDVAIEDIQRICSELRPRLLDHLGLVAALEWQAAEFSGGSGIQCTLALPEHGVTLSDEVSTALFRIVQEALTNVARHSGAGEVTVRLNVNSDVSLVIEDNGRGISAEEMADTGACGIMGIRERVLQLGGSITIDGSPGKGTTIRLSVPIKQREATNAPDA